MNIIQTLIRDVVIIDPVVFEDERGWFMESFNEERFQSELKHLNLPNAVKFVQDNHSLSKKGVLRGLHYQLPPHAMGKLIRVVKGAIYDVAVDIRQNSSTFGQSVYVELNADNKRMLWIPEGFAHGFLTLEDNTHVLYKTTCYYNQSCDATLNWSDSTINIGWPLIEKPVLSKKDQSAPYLDEIKCFYS